MPVEERHIQADSASSAFLAGRERLAAIALCVIVFAAGCVYSVSLGDALRFEDEHEYLGIADRLRTIQLFSLDGVHPTAWRPPAWPAFLASLRFLGASVTLLRIVNFALLAGALYLLFAIVRLNWTPLAALAAVVVASAYPLFFFAAGTLYSQVFAAFLLLAAIRVLQCRENPGLRWMVAGGLFAGLLLLTVPTFVVIIPLLALLVRGDRQSKVRVLLVVTACCVLLVGGWTARNMARFDSLFFVTTSSGYNLLIGNSEDAGANTGTTVNISRYENVARNLDELERDRYFRSQALHWISTHKAHAVRLFALKALNIFNFKSEGATEGESSLFRDLLLFSYYGVILAGLAIRLTQRRRLPLCIAEWVFLAMFGAYALADAVFMVRIRHRIPIDFLLIAVVAPAILIPGRQAWELTPR